jgi:8-oxo-dGTP pyrophosphatase MutT (NUDIX family)
MVFAAGASVFPGGRVDASDAKLPWSGRRAETFAAEFGCEVELARALVGAAVRETFEETGVLLTSPRASLAHRQAEVETGRLGFGALLTEHGLAIDADLIRPWARWVTPPGAPTRRYDTRFFVAVLPDGAVAEDLTTESTVGGWTTPADALAAAARRERSLMPPTGITLMALADYSTAAEVVAAASTRSLEVERPEFRADDEGNTWTVLPDGTRFLHAPTGVR